MLLVFHVTLRWFYETPATHTKSIGGSRDGNTVGAAHHGGREVQRHSAVGDGGAAGTVEAVGTEG